MHLMKRSKSFSPSSSSFVMVSVRPPSTVTTVRVRGVREQAEAEAGGGVAWRGGGDDRVEKGNGKRRSHFV